MMRHECDAENRSVSFGRCGPTVETVNHHDDDERTGSSEARRHLLASLPYPMDPEPATNC